MKEEIVVIVDENDNEIGSATRKEMREKNLFFRGTGIMTFNSNGEILIHKRTMTKDKYPGHYDMFNGGVVSYGETYEQNAKREIKEELGVKKFKLTPLFKFKYDKKDNRAFIMVYSMNYDGPIKFQKSEVEFGKFVSLKELRNMIKKEKFCPDGIEMFKEYIIKYYKK